MTQFKVDFNDFKRRDNTNLMEITLYKDSGEEITPNRDHQWVAKAIKFGDGDKRLDQELAVTLDGDKIGVPSKQLENLPSGDYGLELWEVNNDSKTIYPSAGFIEFHIHRNADESLESVTPTTDLDKIIDDLHQAGLNVVVDDIEMLAPDAKPSVTSEVRDGKNHIKLHIPRGSKGEQGDPGPAPTLKIGTVTKLNPDQTPTVNLSGGNGSYTLDMGIPQGQTGTVDNAGLTNAPAFQALQTQVNNSAVGINLLQGTSTTDNKGPLDFSRIPVTVGDNYTFSGVMSSPSTIGAIAPYIQFYDGSGTKLKEFHKTINVPVASGTKFVITATAPANTVTARVVLAQSVGSITINYRSFKFEHGSQATDWCPNPSEILTQADYAKIQAAIVALGGSL